MKIKNILSLMIALQMVLGSLAWGDPWTKAGTRILKEFERLGVKDGQATMFAAKTAKGKAFNGVVIAGGKYDGKVLLGGETSANKLRQWNDFKKLFREEMKAAKAKAQTRQSIVNGLMGGSPPMSEVLMKMGPETLSFFVALGTIQYAKMIFDPGMNPLGTYQQVESQFHPITHISFGAFMYANGAVVPILQSIIKPTNFLHKYISYMGMSAGMLTSDTVHEISAVMDGKLEKCIADLDTQVNKFEEIAESCDKAFETWAEFPLDFVMSLVPSVASLITSFVVTQRIEKTIQNFIIKKGGQHLIKAIPIVGEISMALQAKRWVVHTLINVLPFTVASEIIGEPVAHSMKTFTATANMDEIQRDVMYDLTRASASGWSEETAQKATESVYKTAMLFKQWRTLNFEKLNATYSSWLAKVGKLSSQYNLSEYIYDQFVSMTEPDAKRVSYQYLMRRPAPLYGITQLTEEGKSGDSEYENPRNVMIRQLQQIVKVTADYNTDYSILKGNDFKISSLDGSGFDLPKSRFAPAILRMAQEDFSASKAGYTLENAGNLNESERQLMTSVLEKSQQLNDLASKALGLGAVSQVEDFFATCNQIGKIFIELNSQAGYKSYYPGLHPGSVDTEFEMRLRAGRSTEQIALERARVEFKRFFRNQFGNPFPITQPGGLFFAALEERKEVKSNSLLLRPTENVDQMVSLRPAQKIFTDMFFGPNSGARGEVFEAHRLNLGFTKFGHDISSMNPPRLLPNTPSVTYLHDEAQRRGKGPGYPTLLNTPVSIGKKTYNNFYDYALDSWQGAFAVKTAKELKEFWKNNVLPGYQEAWADLQPFYEHFLEKMYAAIRSKEKSVFNRGPLHDGSLAQIDLEKKLYLLMLGEVLRSFKLDDSAFAPKVDFVKLDSQVLNKKYIEPGPLVRTFEASGDRVQLLSSLNQNKSLVLFDYFKQVPDSKYAGWKEDHPGQNLYIQFRIESQFNQMTHFIDSIKIEKNTTDSNKAKIISPFTNKEIVSKRDEIQAKLSAWKSLEEEPIPGIKAQLTGQKLRAYQLSLTGLRMLIGELATYALMGNELSFYRADSNPGRAGVQDPECMKEMAGMKMGASGTSKAQFNSKCAGGSHGMKPEQKK